MKLLIDSKTIGRSVVEDARLFLAEGRVLFWNNSGHTSRIVECRIVSHDGINGVGFCTKSGSVFMAVPECDEDLELLSSIVKVLTTDMMKEKLHSFF